MKKRRVLKLRWLLLAAIAGVPVWYALSGQQRGPSSAGTGPVLAVMSYNAGNYRHPMPNMTDVVGVIQRAGVPDLLLLQDNPHDVGIPRLARKLGLPYYVSGRLATPAVNASLLSRYPLHGARTLLFDNHSAAGIICATVSVPAAEHLACSLYMPSLSGEARPAVADPDSGYGNVIRLLWKEAFGDNPRSRNVVRILDWLGDSAAATVIIGGDFNTIPQSRAIRAMSRHFDDALWFTADNSTGTYTQLDFPIRPRIDYLFHSSDIVVEDAAVVRDTAGDHYPIETRMRLPAVPASPPVP